MMTFCFSDCHGTCFQSAYLIFFIHDGAQHNFDPVVHWARGGMKGTATKGLQIAYTRLQIINNEHILYLYNTTE
jgi:hypothetical protein